jgi:hypothetical protein
VVVEQKVGGGFWCLWVSWWGTCLVGLSHCVTGWDGCQWVCCELYMAGDEDSLVAVACLAGRRVWDGQGWPRRSILRGILLGQLG